jgi:hypothetical protein
VRDRFGALILDALREQFPDAFDATSSGGVERDLPMNQGDRR